MDREAHTMKRISAKQNRAKTARDVDSERLTSRVRAAKAAIRRGDSTTKKVRRQIVLTIA